MPESHDQDQPEEDQPQVEKGSVVGLPPSNPPPPPPGGGVMHADEVTEDWSSDDDSNNANANQGSNAADDASSEASDDAASEVSEDAISVLAQVAVEEAMEAAVRQTNDDNQDSINANVTVICGEQELTSTEPEGLSQRYLNDSNSDDSEEDARGWRFGQNSPAPSSPRPMCLTNKMQPPENSDDDEEEPESLQEVTLEDET